MNQETKSKPKKSLIPNSNQSTTPTEVMPPPATLVAPNQPPDSPEKIKFFQYAAQLFIPDIADPQKPTIQEIRNFFHKIHRHIFNLQGNHQTLYTLSEPLVRVMHDLDNHESGLKNLADDELKATFKKAADMLEKNLSDGRLLDFASRQKITAQMELPLAWQMKDLPDIAEKTAFLQQAATLSIPKLKKDNEPTLKEIRNFFAKINDFTFKLIMENKIDSKTFEVIIAIVKPINRAMNALDKHESGVEVLSDAKIKKIFEKLIRALDDSKKTESLMNFADEYGITAKTRHKDLGDMVDEVKLSKEQPSNELSTTLLGTQTTNTQSKI